MSKDDCQLFCISEQPEITTFVPLYEVTHVTDDDSNSNKDMIRKKKPHISNKNKNWNVRKKLCKHDMPIGHGKVGKTRCGYSEFRYHVESEVNKFLHLKPGAISDNLREALGLKANQLPEHIYRMRSLGYPPGWLLEAKSNPSGIEMFDSNGNRVPNAGEEEGEIGNGYPLYNEDKIISYPGFNVWPAPGTIDETEHYNVSDLEKLPSREEFIKQLQNKAMPKFSFAKADQCPVVYRRVFDKLDIVRHEEDALGIMGSMDFPKSQPLPYGDFFEEDNKYVTSRNVIDNYEEKFYLSIKSIKNATTSDSMNKDTNKIITKHIDEIGHIFLALKAQINNLKRESVVAEKSRMQMSVEETEGLENDSKTEDKGNTNLDNSLDKMEIVEPNIDSFSCNHGRVKITNLGTPVIKIHSPYQRLPPPQAFKRDISDIIHFENLPNSTGKYRKLKGLLRNVRTKMSKLKKS